MINTNNLQDAPIHVKFKLSALWASVMFCYIYGDFFTLFVPGRIQHLMEGNSGAGDTTPVKLLLFAILMATPPLMLFLSLILKPEINRILNLLIGLFFTAIMALVVATSTGTWMLFYIFLGIIEITITSLIVWYAWKWPRM